MRSASAEVSDITETSTSRAAWPTLATIAERREPRSPAAKGAANVPSNVAKLRTLINVPPEKLVAPYTVDSEIDGHRIDPLC